MECSGNLRYLEMVSPCDILPVRYRQDETEKKTSLPHNSINVSLRSFDNRHKLTHPVYDSFIPQPSLSTMSDSLRRSSRRSKKQSYTVGDIVEVSGSAACSYAKGSEQTDT
jgi:hypothetical protein